MKNIHGRTGVKPRQEREQLTRTQKLMAERNIAEKKLANANALIRELHERTHASRSKEVQGIHQVLDGYLRAL